MRWEASGRTIAVACCLQDFLKHFCEVQIKLLLHSFRSSPGCLSILKKSGFISSNRSDSLITNNLSIAVHNILMSMLISLSVEEIRLPRFMKWSTNFRRLTLNAKMTPIILIFLWNFLNFKSNLKP